MKLGVGDICFSFCFSFVLFLERFNTGVRGVQGLMKIQQMEKVYDYVDQSSKYTVIEVRKDVISQEDKRLIGSIHFSCTSYMSM